MSVNYIDIPGRLRSVALDGQVAGANQVYDDDKNMFQSAINSMTDSSVNTHINDSSVHVTTSDKNNWNSKASTDVATTEKNGLMSSGDKTKLNGIASGAEVNVQVNWNENNSDSDAYILNKPTSLPASDVFTWAKQPNKPTYTKDEVGLGNVTNDAQVKRTEIGTANGVAELDENGIIITSQLPSYVDDVIEADSSTGFPQQGESGKIYVDKSDNNTYRWSGSGYIEISPSLALGETSSTAYRGDRGKIAYDHSQAAHAPSNAQPNQNAFSNVTAGGVTASAGTTTDTLNLVNGNNITMSVSGKNITINAVDTKNTAGSTNSTDKIFLIGATSQEVNPQTYSNVNTYIDASGNLFNNGYGVLTTDTGLTEKEIGKLASILALAQNCGSVESTTNPEWVYVLIDADNKVLLGINRDHQVKIYTDLDELLEYITPSPYSVADLYNALDSSYYTTDETFTQEEILKLGLILSLGNASNAIEKISNPEYKFAMLDSSTHVLLGVKNDDSWYLSDTMDEMLAIVIDGYRGSGAFADRPTDPFLGQQYFCTDKQTTEGSTIGIPIWYNGTNWVDALGRTIS